jgi:hypothetical protein
MSCSSLQRFGTLPQMTLLLRENVAQQGVLIRRATEADQNQLYPAGLCVSGYHATSLEMTLEAAAGRQHLAIFGGDKGFHTKDNAPRQIAV